MLCDLYNRSDIVNVIKKKILEKAGQVVYAGNPKPGKDGSTRESKRANTIRKTPNAIGGLFREGYSGLLLGWRLAQNRDEWMRL